MLGCELSATLAFTVVGVAITPGKRKWLAMAETETMRWWPHDDVEGKVFCEIDGMEINGKGMQMIFGVGESFCEIESIFR